MLCSFQVLVRCFLLSSGPVGCCSYDNRVDSWGNPLPLSTCIKEENSRKLWKQTDADVRLHCESNN